MEGLRETDLMFSSYENYGNNILGHNLGGDQISSLGPNIMSNEIQRAQQQVETGLLGDVVVGLVHTEKDPNTTSIENQKQQQVNGNYMVVPHGVRNEKGKEIIIGDLGNETEEKRKGKEIFIDLENVGKEKEKKKRRKTNHQPLDLATRVKIEQERRNKEAQLYAELRAMHSNLHPKVPKFRIIEETMSSIASLNKVIQSLEKQKLERSLSSFTNTSIVEPLEPFTNKKSPLLSPVNNLNTISGASTLNTFKTWTSSNITLNVCGTCAVINICSLKRHGLFTTICFILKNHNLDVVSAGIFSNHVKTMYMIHVRGYVPPEFTEGYPYENLYKNAVDQIKSCLDM